MAGFASTFRHRNRTPFRARGRGAGQWNPYYLPSFRYWLDRSAVTDGMTSWVPSVDADAAGNSSFAASTAAPLGLGYSAPSVYLPGGTGNYLASASNVNHAGDFTARVYLQHSSATATSSEFVGDRSGSSGEAIFRYHTTIDLLNLLWWESGVAKQEQSVAHGVADGENVWFGVERINDSGGVWRVRFYKTSSVSPSLTDWTGWTLMNTAPGGAAASPTASSTTLKVGGPTVPMTGRIYRAITSNNGTTTADFDAALMTQAGYTDAYGNVWTPSFATTGRKLVIQSVPADTDHGVVLLGANDYGTGPTGAIPPCANTDSATMLAVIRPRATQSTGTVFSTRSGTGAGVTVRMASATTIVADVSDGTTTNTAPAVTFTPGVRSVVGVVLDSAGTAYCVVNNTAGSTVARPANTQAGGALTFGAISTPANYLDAEAESWFLSMDAKISAAHLANLANYYNAGS